jgi:N5-(carboxyethyl)ornithine synthase
MKLGFITPNYPNERRVCLLPQDISNFENEIVVEQNFGANLDISDRDYIKAGCKVASRKDIFEECDAIVSLKLIQPSDYNSLRENQMIIGWTHPAGSGKEFMEKQAIPKNLIVVDLDNIYPSVYYKDQKEKITWIKPNFVRENSFIAGYSATLHAFMTMGMLPNSNKKIAILGSGNVAQGAFFICSKFTENINMFYRKTLNELKDKLGEYDVIINGIGVDKPNTHILSFEDQKKLKDNCLIIDAAADLGNAIEGTVYTTIDKPIYKKNNLYYYEVTNVPSIFYRESSRVISKAFSENVYKKDVKVFKELIFNSKA